MRQRINGALRRIPIWAVWLFGLVPLALLVWDTVQGRLGVDPIPVIEHRLGRTALYFMIGGLAVTPALRLLRLNFMRFRRALGLLAFTYLCVHVLAWVVLDMGLIWAQMAKDILKRPYLTFGMGAFVMLIPLALTSSDRALRRMGGAAWRQLHMLVYPAAGLAVLHYLWVGKVAKPWTLACLAAILILLLLRLTFRRPTR